MQLLNLKEKIDNNLNPDIKKIIYDCSRTAREKNFKIFLVGGLVRDLLLNKKILDIDITVQGNAIHFCELLEKNQVCKIIQKQTELKTAKIRFPNGIEIDFTSTRQEIYPRKGHLPVVTETGCLLFDDVKRRDFTVNAIAASLNSENFGQIIDYTGGMKDIENKILRILHKNSFIDDPSRIIRGLKFSVRFGFQLDEKTKKLQEEYLNNPDLNISMTRIKTELQQAFDLNSPLALQKCLEQKIYKIFSPSAHENINPQYIYDLINKYCSEIKHVWLIYLGTLFTSKQVIELFNFEKQEKRILTDALDMISENPQITDSFEIYKFFENKNIESIIIFCAVTKNEIAAIFLEKLRNHQVEITGNELINMGFTPGALFKDIFDSILKERLSGNILNKNDEISFIKNFKK